MHSLVAAVPSAPLVVLVVAEQGRIAGLVVETAWWIVERGEVNVK